MKKPWLLLALCSISLLSCTPEDFDNRYLDKVQTLDSTMATLYDVISGPAGEARDWDLFKYLFKPGAHLIPSGIGAEQQISCRFMTPNDYVQTSGTWLEKNGFFETEISRKTESFSNITQVWSTYAARKKAEDAAPFMRGINSIQLLKDEKRWWIVNIYWVNESESAALPMEYL